MKKANRKILIVAIALLLTLVTVSTGTLAWFSMNTKAKGTGMQMEATAPTNMLISTDTIVWKNGIVATTDILGGFAPSSTIDGKNFFALASTEGIAVTGSIIDGSNIAKVDVTSVPRVDDTNTYYVEFPLYIKATEDTSKQQDLELYLEDFTVSTTTHNLQKAIRISITSVTPNGENHETGPVTVQDNGTVKDSEEHVLVESAAIIYKYDTLTSVKPIESVSEGTPTLAATDTAITTETTPTCFTVDYTGNYYSTIIVRMWIEGQHPNCINETAGETVSISLLWRVKEQA